MNQHKTVPARAYFPKAKIAREELREKATELINLLIENAVEAKAAGEFETAAKSLQWLLEHMPSDDDGTKVIDTSVDKQAKTDSLPKGPNIQIGVAIGGIPQKAELPPATDVEVVEVVE